MTKSIKKFLLLLLLPIIFAATVHKFYVSVTEMQYDEEEKSFQITSRIFIDDLEAVIHQRYDVKTQLATSKEDSRTDELIGKYLGSKFVVKINGKKRAFTYLGKEYRDDLVVCYMEIPDINLADIKSIEIKNDVLTELFEEQQNVVHLKIGSKKKSFILMRENNKGMLNL
ncbi:MAG: DUF6702 family protein [Flavobacteriaceae bacterium]